MYLPHSCTTFTFHTHLSTYIYHSMGRKPFHYIPLSKTYHHLMDGMIIYYIPMNMFPLNTSLYIIINKFQPLNLIKFIYMNFPHQTSIHLFLFTFRPPHNIFQSFPLFPHHMSLKLYMHKYIQLTY